MRLEWYRNYHYFLMVQLVASGLLRSDLIIYLVLAWWRPGGADSVTVLLVVGVEMALVPWLYAPLALCRYCLIFNDT